MVTRQWSNSIINRFARIMVPSRLVNQDSQASYSFRIWTHRVIDLIRLPWLTISSRISVDDVQAAYDRFVSLNVTILQTPAEGGGVAMIADPDGYNIEVRTCLFALTTTLKDLLLDSSSVWYAWVTLGKRAIDIREMRTFTCYHPCVYRIHIVHSVCRTVTLCWIFE